MVQILMEWSCVYVIRWLRQTRSYIAPVEIGAVMRGGTISQIIETGSEVDSAKFKKGDWVAATSGWQEYAVLDQKSVEKLEVPEGCVPLDFMSSLGMVALTAYFGITVGHFSCFSIQPHLFSLGVFGIV